MVRSTSSTALLCFSEHARGDVRDGGIEFLGHAPDALQELILLGADAGGSGSEAAEVEELS